MPDLGTSKYDTPSPNTLRHARLGESAGYSTASSPVPLPGLSRVQVPILVSQAGLDSVNPTYYYTMYVKDHDCKDTLPWQSKVN